MNDTHYRKDGEERKVTTLNLNIKSVSKVRKKYGSLSNVVDKLLLKLLKDPTLLK